MLINRVHVIPIAAVSAGNNLPLNDIYIYILILSHEVMYRIISPPF